MPPESHRGEVTEFDAATSKGRILSKDEATGTYHSYSFTGAGWKSAGTAPTAGVAVQFRKVDDDNADDIEPIPDTSSNPLESIKNRLDVVAVAVAVLSGIVALVFIFLPNLQPATERAVTISAVSVEPGVSFGDYLKHTTRRLVPERPMSCLQRLRESLATPLPTARPASAPSATPGPSPVILDPEPGLSIHFTFTASGFAGECVVSEPVVFDGVTGRRVANRSNIVIQQPWETDLRDADTASGELWVPDAMVEGLRSIVARVELYSYSQGKIQPLAYADSVRLCLPQALPCTSSSPSP
jgi:hypothetical protein